MTTALPPPTETPATAAPKTPHGPKARAGAFDLLLETALTEDRPAESGSEDAAPADTEPETDDGPVAQEIAAQPATQPSPPLPPFLPLQPETPAAAPNTRPAVEALAAAENAHAPYPIALPAADAAPAPSPAPTAPDHPSRQPQSAPAAAITTTAQAPAPPPPAPKAAAASPAPAIPAIAPGAEPGQPDSSPSNNAFGGGKQLAHAQAEPPAISAASGQSPAFRLDSMPAALPQPATPSYESAPPLPPPSPAHPAHPQDSPEPAVNNGIRIEIGRGEALDIRIGAADHAMADRVASELDLLHRDLAAIGAEVEAIHVEVRSEKAANPTEPLLAARQGPAEQTPQHPQRQPPRWRDGEAGSGRAGEQERQGQDMHIIETGGQHRVNTARRVDRYA